MLPSHVGMWCSDLYPWHKRTNTISFAITSDVLLPFKCRYICFIIYIIFIIYKQLSNVVSVRTCSRNFVCKSWCFLFTQGNYLKTVVLHKIELVNTPERYCTIHIMYFNVKMCSHNERFVKWVPNTETLLIL